MRKIISIATLCFLILMTFSGCGILQKLGLQKSADDELQPASSIVMGEDEAKKLTDKVPIHLYFANEDNTRLKLEVRYIPMADARKSTSNLASIIVKELIKGPSADTGYKPTIPAGTLLRSPVSINARTATVDLSKEFQTKHPGGKDAEKMTIYSIVNSLTELKEIQKVKFTIAGKTKKEFMGNFQFDASFPRSTALISKEAIVPGTGGTPDAQKQDTKKSVPTTTPSKDSEKKPSGSTTTSGETQETSGGSDDTLEMLE